MADIELEKQDGDDRTHRKSVDNSNDLQTMTVNGDLRFAFYLARNLCVTLRQMVRQQHRILATEHDRFIKLWFKQKMKTLSNSLVVQVITFAGVFVLFALWFVSNSTLKDLKVDLNQLLLKQQLLSDNVVRLCDRFATPSRDADALPQDIAHVVKDASRIVNDTSSFMTESISGLKLQTRNAISATTESITGIKADVNVRLNAVGATLDTELAGMKLQVQRVVHESDTLIQECCACCLARA